MAMSKAETKTLLALLAEVPEHRKGNAIKYSLRDVLFLGIFAILCGAETYTGMSTFSELHKEELQRYMELPHGIPSHDVFGDIFSRVDKEAVSKCFQVFVDAIVVFCKPFLEEIAKHFWRLLQLQNGGSCSYPLRTRPWSGASARTPRP